MSKRIELLKSKDGLVYWMIDGFKVGDDFNSAEKVLDAFRGYGVDCSNLDEGDLQFLQTVCKARAICDDNRHTTKEAARLLSRALNDLIEREAQLEGRPIVYVAMNLRNPDNGMAPVIYRQYEDGLNESRTAPWSEVYQSWQKPNGESASGDIRRDVAECLTTLCKLEIEGHHVSRH